MIKFVDYITETFETEKITSVKLVADTKEEVADNLTGEDVEGLNANIVVGMGSKVLTADGYLGIMRSDNTWSWLNE